MIHNWLQDLAHTPVPARDNPIRRELGLGDEVVFAYSGNLGRAHRFDSLLTVGERLRDRRDLRFLIIGDGPQKAGVDAAAREHSGITVDPKDPAALLVAVEHLAGDAALRLRMGATVRRAAEKHLPLSAAVAQRGSLARG